jgi:predicted nicotinamide N-methyase
LVVVEAIAEVVLSASVQAQFLAHARSIGLQESQKATDMIVVSVADDQRVHLADIDLHKLEVVHVNVRREAEVEQISARFLSLA